MHAIVLDSVVKYCFFFPFNFHISPFLLYYEWLGSMSVCYIKAGVFLCHVISPYCVFQLLCWAHVHMYGVSEELSNQIGSSPYW